MVEKREKYRLYIDESGNSDLQSAEDPRHRFLSLTGVIINLDYVRTTVFPTFEILKQDHFFAHPDKPPVILHRTEIIHCQGSFEVLKNKQAKEKYNENLISLLKNISYIVITVAIDKLEYKNKYTVWHWEPYHYCLAVMLERYVLWLQTQNACGDVMAESRGAKEDRRLKDSYTRICLGGFKGSKIPIKLYSNNITSIQLKMMKKEKNIIGLQLADILAQPSFRAMRLLHDMQPIPEDFGGLIARILEDKKWHRSENGRIDGYGRKWLP